MQQILTRLMNMSKTYQELIDAYDQKYHQDLEDLQKSNARVRKISEKFAEKKVGVPSNIMFNVIISHEENKCGFFKSGGTHWGLASRERGAYLRRRNLLKSLHILIREVQC